MNNNLTALYNLPPNIQSLTFKSNPLIYDFEPTLENIRQYPLRAYVLSVKDNASRIIQ
jgi:hypothetical protein